MVNVVKMSLVARSAWARFLQRSYSVPSPSWKGKLQRRLSSMVLPSSQPPFSHLKSMWQMKAREEPTHVNRTTFSVLTASLHNPFQSFPNPSLIWNVKLHISVVHLSRVWMKVPTHSFCLASFGECLFGVWIFSPQSQTFPSVVLWYRPSRDICGPLIQRCCRWRPSFALQTFS